MILPTDPEDRKAAPICRGALDYFPLAIAEIARLSLAATLQHHPDKPMHWDRAKSTDHEDCLVRHLIERGTIDTDGQRHTAKAAWRALALLQLELEQALQEELKPEKPEPPSATQCPYRDPKRMRLDRIDVV